MKYDNLCYLIVRKEQYRDIFRSTKLANMLEVDRSHFCSLQSTRMFSLLHLDTSTILILVSLSVSVNISKTSKLWNISIQLFLKLVDSICTHINQNQNHSAYYS